MGRVQTNDISLSYAIEDTENEPDNIGRLAGEQAAPEAGGLTIPGTPTWFLLEPNDLSQYGNTVTRVSRNPISRRRQRRRGTTTDLDSGVEFDAELTHSHFDDFSEGFVFARYENGDLDLAVSAVDGTAGTYTIEAVNADQAARLNFTATETATLVFARGFISPLNNGIRELDADVADTGTTIDVVEPLSDEATPPTNAELALAGVRSLAGAADLTWAWDPLSLRATLTSAGNIVDFEALGLFRGQFVHIGSPDAQGVLVNGFENGAPNDMVGWARVVDFVAGGIIFDKVDVRMRFNDVVAPTTAVDVLFGKFLRNVDVGTVSYLFRTFQFELETPGLGAGGASEFQYALGNTANTLSISLPLTDVATITPGFIGTFTNDPDPVQKQNASTPIEPVQPTPFNTSGDIARLRLETIDETGLTTDFKSVTLNLGNNASGEKVLGQLGPRFINVGNFEVDLETQVLFTNGEVVRAIRCNEDVSMEFILTNGDGAIVIDIPSMTLGDGSYEFPTNETVLINIAGEAHGDNVFGTSIGISVLPFAPVNADCV